MEKKLSFVIPVYNVEAYLPQCLDSIVSQMTEECELILVDDGGTDSSGAICDRYQQQFPGVRVLHKANGGPSAARNSGVALAQGQYICYVDSDDYIRQGTVARLLEWIRDRGRDICFLQSDKVYPTGREESVGEGLTQAALEGKTSDQVLRYLASAPKFPGGPWGKLFRRELLESNHITFPEGRLSEDLVYNLEAFFAAGSFDCLDFPFYCYRQARAESLTNTVTEKYSFDTAQFVQEVARDYRQDAHSPRGECALSYGAYEYAILLWQVLLLPREVQGRAWDWLREYRWILDCGKSPTPRKVRLAVKLVGLKAGARLLDVYQKHRN